MITLTTAIGSTFQITEDQVDKVEKTQDKVVVFVRMKERGSYREIIVPIRVKPDKQLAKLDKYINSIVTSS